MKMTHIFLNAKVIYSLYEEADKIKFPKNFVEKLAFDEIPTDELNINGTIDIEKLHEIGINWSDAISICSENISANLSAIINLSEKPALDFHDEEQTIESTSRFL